MALPRRQLPRLHPNYPKVVVAPGYGAVAEICWVDGSPVAVLLDPEQLKTIQPHVSIAYEGGVRVMPQLLMTQQTETHTGYDADNRPLPTRMRWTTPLQADYAQGVLLWFDDLTSRGIAVPRVLRDALSLMVQGREDEHAYEIANDLFLEHPEIGAAMWWSPANIYSAAFASATGEGLADFVGSRYRSAFRVLYTTKFQYVIDAVMAEADLQWGTSETLGEDYGNTYSMHRGSIGPGVAVSLLTEGQFNTVLPTDEEAYELANMAGFIVEYHDSGMTYVQSYLTEADLHEAWGRLAADLAAGNDPDDPDDPDQQE